MLVIINRTFEPIKRGKKKIKFLLNKFIII